MFVASQHSLSIYSESLSWNGYGTSNAVKFKNDTIFYEYAMCAMRLGHNIG